MKTLLNVEFFVNFFLMNSIYESSIFNELSNLLKKNKNRIRFYEEDTEYKELIQSFHNYEEDTKFDSYIHLNKSYKKIFTDELVDYHGGYHKVMKEINKLLYKKFSKTNCLSSFRL